MLRLKILFRNTFIAFILFIIPLFITIPLFGQNLPVGQEPGAQAERFSKDNERKKEPKIFKTPVIEEPTRIDSTSSGSKALSFTLQQVDFVGNKEIDSASFAPLYKEFIGKSVTMEELQAIATGVKNIYRKRGYFAVSAYFPEQDVLEGRLTLRIIEGKLGALSIEGNRWTSTKILERYFHTVPGEVLNFKKIQRDLLRLNQSQDLEVKTVIMEGKTPETADIVLQVKDKFPWHLGVGVDNSGGRLTGKYRESLSLRSTNTTGNLDTLFINTMFSTNTFGQSLNYELPLTTHGTKFGFSQTFFKMRLGEEYEPYHITGKSYIYSPYLTQELILNEDQDLYATIGLDIKSIKKKQEYEILTHDELRLPFIAFDYRKQHHSGQTTFSPRISFNTEDWLGASAQAHPSASRTGSDSFSVKYEHTLRRLQKMPFDSYLSLRTQAQISSHTLPSSEQFQLGGVYSVRGYPEGDYLADNGVCASAEWILPMYFIPANWRLKNSPVALRHQIEPLLFVDVGTGKLKNLLPGEERHKFLLGVGGGVRVRVYNNIYFRCEWAKHLGDEPVGGAGQSTFRFGLQTEM